MAFDRGVSHGNGVVISRPLGRIATIGHVAYCGVGQREFIAVGCIVRGIPAHDPAGSGIIKGEGVSVRDAGRGGTAIGIAGDLGITGDGDMVAVGTCVYRFAPIDEVGVATTQGDIGNRRGGAAGAEGTIEVGKGRRSRRKGDTFSRLGGRPLGGTQQSVRDYPGDIDAQCPGIALEVGVGRRRRTVCCKKECQGGGDFGQGVAWRWFRHDGTFLLGDLE